MAPPERADELVERILAHAPRGVAALIEAAGGHERDWLELKAAIFDSEPKPGENRADYYWNVAHAVIAMANTRGGALILGVDDKTKEAVGLHRSDPEGIIRSAGIEDFVRTVIGDLVLRPKNGWKLGLKRAHWRLNTALPLTCVETTVLPYQDDKVLVLVVHPVPADGELLFITDPDNRLERLPTRILGDVGETRDLYSMSDIEQFKKDRKISSPQFTMIWREAAASFGVGSSEPAGEDRRLIQGLIRNNLPGWKGKRNQDLIGREDELAELTKAFEDPVCSTVCVIAEGGYGKSALVTRWLEEIRDRPSPGAYLNVEAGFAYSFYKQGWERQSAASSVPFFADCLMSLSEVERDRLPVGGTEVWANRILDILRRQPSLLLLDGLEPHQSPPNADPPGEVRDIALKNFIKGMDMRRGGLCIITSRIRLAELEGHLVATHKVRVLELKALSPEASRDLLRAGGVRSDHPHLDYWARESGGHPLFLALLAPAIEKGNYDPETFESHRVLNDNKQDISYTIQKFVLSQYRPLGREAQAVLLATSMFDKPVPYRELRELLLKRAIIPRITEPFYTPSGLLRRRSFSELAFIRGAKILQENALLTVVGSLEDRDDCTLELHPLIQAGVRGDLMKNDKSLWRRANWTIYKGFCGSVKPWRPDTRGDLEKLYAAVPHGVNAGKGRAAGWMYANRCLRGFRGYSTTSHGMIAEDVVALSHYFEGNFGELKQDIGVTQYKYGRVQAYVWAGTLLTAVNRWNEGRRLMKHGLEMALENRDFTTAARTARNLGVGHAIAGELEVGEKFARQSVELVQCHVPLSIRLIESMRARSFKLVNVPYERVDSLSTLGSLLHYQGNFKAAGGAFHDAEIHQAAAVNGTALLGLAGFRHVELMLDQCKFEQADRLIEQAMRDPGVPPGWGEKKFVEALFHLAFVRARIRRADTCGDRSDWEAHWYRASQYAQDFARFGQELRMDWLVPLFRIALSGIARLSAKPGLAILPIEEAEKRVTQFSNRLFETDVHMEHARVCLALGDRQGAARRIRQAQDLSDKIGYRCKDSEIASITQLCS